MIDGEEREREEKKTRPSLETNTLSFLLSKESGEQLSGVRIQESGLLCLLMSALGAAASRRGARSLLAPTARLAQGWAGAASSSTSQSAATTSGRWIESACFQSRGGWHGSATPALSRGFAFGFGGSKDKDEKGADAASAGGGGGEASTNASGTIDSFDSSAAADVLSTTTSASSSASSIAAASINQFDPSQAVAAAEAAEQAALLAARDGVWLFNSGFQSLLEFAHASSGLPWWGAIAATTVAARALMLPVVAKQMKNTAAMAAARPEMLALQQWFKDSQASPGFDVRSGTQEYQQRLAAVWSKHDCHPVKSMAPLLMQAPLFIGFFSALRSLAEAGVPSLARGGAAWFHDLTVADPTYGLPLLSAAIFLLTVELNAADGMQGQDPATMRKMKNFMRFLAVALVPLTASMPAGVFVYWATSNACSLGQSALFKLSATRRTFGLPPLGVAASAAVPLPGAALSYSSSAAAAAAGGGAAAAALKPSGAPTPAAAAASAAAAAASAGKPVVTFASRPPRRKTGNRRK